MVAIFSSSRKPGWLAVLCRDGRITLAAGRRLGRRAEISLLESFADDGDVRAALARLRAARRFASYRCVTLMNDGGYQITPLDAPGVPREERREALRWSLRGRVDYPVETACLAVLDVPGDGAPGRAAGVLVVSADERAVVSVAAPFEDARVPLDAIDVPELAQRNVAALLEDENRGLVLLCLNEAGSLLTLTYRGELVAARRGEIGVRQMLSNDADEAARGRERVVLELQRSLDNFDRQYSHVPVSKVVLAVSPRVDGLIGELAENVYVPVQEMNLASVMDFPKTPELRDPAAQAANLLAIGAALRAEDAA